MTEFHKLVRDRIPEIITAGGQRPTATVLTPPERRPALLAKLAEETAEAAAASQQDLPEELADVLEVVRALAAGLGLSLAEVIALADAKRASRGGFDDGVFLVRTEPAADSTP